MTTTDAEADPSVVAGEISIFDILTNTLIDSGATQFLIFPSGTQSQFLYLITPSQEIWKVTSFPESILVFKLVK